MELVLRYGIEMWRPTWYIIIPSNIAGALYNEIVIVDIIPSPFIQHPSSKHIPWLFAVNAFLCTCTHLAYGQRWNFPIKPPSYTHFDNEFSPISFPLDRCVTDKCRMLGWKCSLFLDKVGVFSLVYFYLVCSWTSSFFIVILIMFLFSHWYFYKWGV